MDKFIFPLYRKHPWLAVLLPLIVIGLCLIALGALRYAGSSAQRPVPLDATSFAPPPAPAPPRPQLIVTYRDVPPEMVTYSPGRHAGPLRVVIEEAANRIGYDIKWIPSPFANSVSAVSAGTIDVVPSALFRTPEREKLMRFSVSLGRVEYLVNFMQRRNGEASIKTFDDLKDHTVGYRRAVRYFDEFESLTGFKRMVFSNDDDMMKAFANRSIDVVMINNKRAAERALMMAGINASNYVYSDLKISQQVDLYLLYSRRPDMQPVFDRFDQALMQMKKENVITDIYKSFQVTPPVID